MYDMERQVTEKEPTMTRLMKISRDLFIIAAVTFLVGFPITGLVVGVVAVGVVFGEIVVK